MVGSVIKSRHLKADATVVQHASQAINSHVSQPCIYMHWQHQRRREQDAVIAKTFQRMNHHVVVGLWVLVVVVDLFNKIKLATSLIENRRNKATEKAISNAGILIRTLWAAL